MTGTILNIQRFSLHDGPGIRTVVYFKGCPLQCMWCSNPESISPNKQLGYDLGRCTQCMECVKYCEFNALQNVNGKLRVTFRNCTACGECIDKCPDSALSIYGKIVSVEEILGIVLRDKKYYDESGGGVTYSGGEAFFQKDFLVSLLKHSRAQGLHTCIETSGYTRPEYIAEAVPYTDIFLYDYKITDRAAHMQFTGQSNSVIVRNLRSINELGTKIFLRCIIIPGINDNDEHFRAIAGLSNELSGIKETHLIPYHDFARSKYPQIGMEYKLHQRTVPREQAEKWLETLKSLGCRNAKIS